MNYRIIFRKNAETHLIEIHDWYEKQKQGLAMNFSFPLKLLYLQ